MSQKNHALLVALAGQPNCGKSTIFNMLTGARQHADSYPWTSPMLYGAPICSGAWS
jgi:Fe2+ transport system protein B